MNFPRLQESVRYTLLVIRFILLYMIGHLRGTVLAKRAGFIILDTGGVGYKVAVTKETLVGTKEREEAALWTYLAVREDVLDLYGFKDEEELRVFTLLLTVPGIGPRSAIATLDIAPIGTLRGAIAAGNASYLTNVSGIGKKTADKIILELREKIGAAPEDSAHALSGDEEALEAMRALGYSVSEARDILRKVPKSVSGGSARLREALKLMGRDA